MSSNIGVGDVVRIVKACSCGRSDKYLGRYYKVLELRSPMERMHLPPRCKNVVTDKFAKLNTGFLWPITWLEKVPPLGELEDAETQERNFQPKIVKEKA